MKKQSKILSIFILIEGLLLIAAGASIPIPFINGTYQGPSSPPLLITFAVMLLMFFFFALGLYLVFFSSKVAKKIQKKQQA